MNRKLIGLLGFLLFALIGCTGQQSTNLVLMTHDSFEISEDTIAAFSEQTGHTVEILKSGDAGELVNKAILAKGDPLADVMFGIDNTFLSRALDNDIFVSYEAAGLDTVPAGLQLDSEHRVTPIDFGDVCLNYDKGWFAENGTTPPTSLQDLADPAYAGLTVVQNPGTSSPGLAFLFATINVFGSDNYLEYWEALVANEVLVVDGWSEAYYGHFTAASDGDRPIVVSYASSPPAEVFFAETVLDEAPTGTVLADGSCFRQIEFAGILQGTANEAAAKELIDFMLGETFQEDIPLNMFVFPANQNASLPPVFVEHGQLPANPSTLTPAEIDANRDAWIDAWRNTVLR